MFSLNLSKHSKAALASSFSSQTSYAVSFGEQCTVVGDASSAFVRVPAVEKTGTTFERIFSTSLGAGGGNATKCIGYGSTANHLIAAFASASALTLLEIDPLAVVSTSTSSEQEGSSGSSNPEEAAEQGCHTYRKLSIGALGSATTSSSFEPIHFASIGNVSAVLILTDSTNINKLLVACIPSVPELFATQTSQNDNNTVPVLSAPVIDISPDVSVEVSNNSTLQVVKSVRTGKHKIVCDLSEGFSIQIEQNNLTEKLSVSKLDASPANTTNNNNKQVTIINSSSDDSTPLQLPLITDDYRPLQEECCICMMNFFPTEDEEDVMPAVCILSCGHAYHRGCIDMDLSRVDDFIKDGRYFRFRRLGCSQCSSSMHDALRFPALEKMFSMRRMIDSMARELDAKSGGSAGDDESLDDRLKRHLFYCCNRCSKPFYGGPYDCGATLTDPKTDPATLICDECCDDFKCSTHGRSNIVYKCQNCWNPAISNKRFLGKLRLCSSCFDAQKGKPAPGDDVVPFAKKNDDKNYAAPNGSPFAFLGKDRWAVCGHDEQGVGLSVAGCGECEKELGALVVAVVAKKDEVKSEEGKEKSPDAAEK